MVRISPSLNWGASSSTLSQSLASRVEVARPFYVRGRVGGDEELSGGEGVLTINEVNVSAVDLDAHRRQPPSMGHPLANGL